MGPQQYRILSPDEIIQEGDEWDWENNWTKTRASGEKAGEHPGRVYRRPIPPTVKESLMANQDESSDNSRSYEISELNRKCSKLFDKAYELQEHLSAMKLRAEKAEAELRFENSECAKWATRAETAERERDEAKDKLQTAEILWNRSHDGWIEAAQERDTLRSENAKLREALEKIASLFRMDIYQQVQETAQIAREAIAEKGKK